MRTRIAIWMLALVMSATHAAAYTGCPGNGPTNSHVVVEYIFHEGSGATAFNTGTGGDAGNATLTNGVTWSSDVPPSNAACGWSASLPATGSGATTPALETAGSYDPLAGATNFTIMAWVRRESLTINNNTAARIASDISALGTNASGFEFRFSGTNGVLWLNINGAERNTTVGGIRPNSNAWHHVAVVYDGTRPATNTLTRNVHFYVDGIQRGDGNTLTNLVVGANTNRLTVGNSSVSRGVLNALVGKIDDVRILRGFAPAAVGSGKTNDIIRCFMNAPDDFEPPRIGCPPDVVTTNDFCQPYAANVELGQPVVSDNCGAASVTSNAPAQFPIGVVSVTWTATDFGGNQSSCTQAVTVVSDLNADSDSDGLTDCNEISQHGTDPTNPDTDGDGMPDGWEVQYGLNPLVNDAVGDLDGDGVDNLTEYLQGRDPTKGAVADTTGLVNLNVFTPLE